MSRLQNRKMAALKRLALGNPKLSKTRRRPRRYPRTSCSTAGSVDFLPTMRPPSWSTASSRMSCSTCRWSSRSRRRSSFRSAWREVWAERYPSSRGARSAGLERRAARKSPVILRGSGFARAPQDDGSTWKRKRCCGLKSKKLHVEIDGTAARALRRHGYLPRVLRSLQYEG